MISEEKFYFIKEKYQFYSSWAVWAEQGNKPKSNVGDLSVLDPKKNKNLLKILNPNIILVALNISRGDIKEPLANFHDKSSRATDFKIRYALKDTPLWGGYMTDIIKDFEELISGNVLTYLKKNKEFEIKNINFFRNELVEIGAKKPTLVAFGNIVYEILNRYLENEFKILKITHYAHQMSKEIYREEVQNILSKF